MRSEDGFTMAVVMIAMLFISLVIVATVSAVNGDLRMTARDLDRKQAFEAAQAGIADYAYHLNSDTNYWTHCATPTPSNPALNQKDAITTTKPVPGSSGARYAIELLAATGQTTCDGSSATTASTTMIEPSTSSAAGTFRIRSTGYSGSTRQRVVATFKRRSFLDYVYFTQLETSDPITYGYTSPAAIAGANSQCSKTAADGRYTAPIPGTSGTYCDYIYFAAGEKINGPLHTNDFLMTQGSPTFGRSPADAIEVSSAAPGWISSDGSSPKFLGTYMTESPVLTPPATNQALATVSGVGSYEGTTRIVLSGTNMTVTTSAGTSTVPIPASGVVYVSTDGACPQYTPFSADATIYPSIASSGCGTVYISGTYSGQLTIGADNDIIIDGDLTRSADGLLGLIANNFVRVRHSFSTQTSKGSCGSGSNSGTTVSRIDAAILAINHSFIVDHYNCGAGLGVLTMNGAISQKYRGPVGLVGGSGYSKNYTYDDRLRYVSPPQFLDPVESPWKVQRQTLDP